MASIRNRITKGWIDTLNEEELKNFWDNKFKYHGDFLISEPKIKDTEMIKIKNDIGETIYLKAHELNSVLGGLLDKVIKEKGFDLYKETQTRLLEKIDEEVEKIESNTNRYFLDKIDALAEKIALNMINSEIEKRVKIKVDKKLNQMKKLLDDE